MPKGFRWLVPAIAVFGMLLVAGPLLAQFGASTGGIVGRVVDEQGNRLPGVSVTIQGPGAHQTIFTDPRGEFRIAQADPAIYTLTIALQGFATVTRENVTVNIGKNTELTITMKVSSVAATVVVTGEAPILETKRVSTGATITHAELASIPTARDPWVILQSVPGVQIDRVNVAGSESGQQSNFSGKGSTAGTFTVDGVNLTDMSALGASAGYYDFDSFQEMQVITGGSDASIQGSGTHLNMVTKRGTNAVHGSARVFDVDHHFQSQNLPANAATQGIAAGNHIDSVQDYGAEVGGPVVKDVLWLWGSYGRDQINLVTANGVLDRTTLENFNAKVNWQIIGSNSFDTWYQRSDKIKFGRSGGPTRPQETTWDQKTPQNTWKLEDSQIFGSSTFFTVQYNGANGDFSLTPEGGLAKQTYLDAAGVWHNTYEFYDAPRPTRQVKADLSQFFSTGSAGHELKAGFGYLQAAAQSTSVWPGDGQNGFAAQTYGDRADCDVDCAVITRNSSLSVKNKYWSAYLQDAVTLDRLTINVGVRWDRQFGRNLHSNIPANASFPTLLPAVAYPGSGEQFHWNDWQPRAGITYAFGANRSTIFKASYARFAEGLGTGITGLTNPTASAAYAYYAWNDANGDNLVQPGEIDLTKFQFSRGYDPASPGALVSPNSIDPKLSAPHTDEFVVGVDQELFPAFAVGAVFTHRKFGNQLFRYRSGLMPTDYVQYTTITGTLPDGTPFSAPVYRIKPGIDTPPGYFYTNRKNYNQTYDGFDIILTKRLADKWMARGSFTYNLNKQHSQAGACWDPTNRVPGQSLESGDPIQGYTASTCADGVFVATQSTGSGNKGGVFLNSKWQFYMNGLYQLPLGFAVSTAITGRQGYPIAWFRRVVGPDGELRDVSVSNLDSQRYKNVFEWDMRVEKVVTITATSNVALSADLFNLTNQNTTLQRFNRLKRSNTGNIKEIQSPRIWRFGARFSF